MANMKRCRSQLSVAVGDKTEHLWPGLEVDLERVLTPARPATAAIGKEGTEGHVQARAAVAAFTLGDAVAGREDCFEEVAAPAQAAGRKHTTSSAAATPQQE